MKAVRVVSTFCTECLEEVSAPVDVVCETVTIRGVALEVANEYPICPLCGERIADPSIMDENLSRQYDAYRELMDVPNATELIALRKKYGMPQRQLAALLGIGIASVQRYENGSLPTEAHIRLLRLLRSSLSVRERMNFPESGLSEKDKAKIMRCLDSASSERIEYHLISISILDLLPRTADALSGFIEFNANRLRQAVVYLASNERNLYKTKLNKLLFYLDFASYRDCGRGFTGLRYAHADYGPVPDRYELIMAALVDEQSLGYKEKGNGQVVVALRGCDESGFGSNEILLLDRIVSLSKRFRTASFLSAFSYEEAAWVETSSGELIFYEYAKRLKGIEKGSLGNSTSAVGLCARNWPCEGRLFRLRFVERVLHAGWPARDGWLGARAKPECLDELANQSCGMALGSKV